MQVNMLLMLLVLFVSLPFGSVADTAEFTVNGLDRTFLHELMQRYLKK